MQLLIVNQHVTIYTALYLIVFLHCNNCTAVSLSTSACEAVVYCRWFTQCYFPFMYMVAKENIGPLDPFQPQPLCRWFLWDFVRWSLGVELCDLHIKHKGTQSSGICKLFYSWKICIAIRAPNDHVMNVDLVSPSSPNPWFNLRALSCLSIKDPYSFY